MSWSLDVCGFLVYIVKLFACVFSCIAHVVLDSWCIDGLHLHLHVLQLSIQNSRRSKILRPTIAFNYAASGGVLNPSFAINALSTLYSRLNHNFNRFSYSPLNLGVSLVARSDNSELFYEIQSSSINFEMKEYPSPCSIVGFMNQANIAEAVSSWKLFLPDANTLNIFIIIFLV